MTRPRRLNGADKVAIGVVAANVVSAFGCIMIGSHYPIVRNSEMLPTAQILAVVIFGAVMLVSGLTFLKRAKNALAVVFFLLFVTPASFFTSLWVLSWVNGAKDESAPVERAARVIGHQVHNGKTSSGNAYFAKLEPWRPGQQWLEVQITYSQYCEIVHGNKERTARLQTRAGRLGWEWIDTIDIV